MENDINDNFTEQGRKLLQEFYCRDGESTPQLFKRACDSFSYGDSRLGRDMYKYLTQGW